MPELISYGATHPGHHRPNNEDTFLIARELRAAILADGMGGENCGEVGSAITVEAIADFLGSPDSDLSAEELAREAIRAANRRVRETARERAECDGMGSTVVLAIWRLPRISIANVGDSRGYLYRAGDLRQLTYDQNYANELRTQLGFTEERVRNLPNRNVLTMAVGVYDQVLIRMHTETLEAGDQVLLCSDGLYGPVRHETIAEILGEQRDAQWKVERLIECANEAGGPDNITAVLLEYPNG
jgi:protein phosphatase